MVSSRPAGHLLGGEIEHVSQDENGALERREQLNGAQESERRPRACERTLLGVGATMLDLEEPVRIGLEPWELRLGGHPGAGVGGSHQPGPPPKMVQAGVRCDLVEPRAHGTLAAVGAKAAPSAQHRLLNEILRVVQRTQHAVAVDVKLSPMRRHEPLEGRAVARQRPIDQRDVVADGGFHARPNASAKGRGS